MEKKLKITLGILVSILIAIIAFAGIYSKDTITYENVLPGYKMASELSGKRVTTFEADKSSEEKIYDKDGNEVDSIPEGANEEEYRKEEIKVNSDEVLTAQNYELVKKLYETRLRTFGAQDYSVRLDKETGNIAVELPEDSNTDTLIQYLLSKGDFSMVDSETKEVLMERSDLEKVSAQYGAHEDGIAVYLLIKFNEEGANKLLDISRTYMKEEGTTEEEESETQKKVTMIIDGSEITSSYFTEEMTTGEIVLTIGETTNSQTMYNYLRQAEIFSVLLNNEEMPIEYNAIASDYIENSIAKEGLYVVIGLIAALALAVIVYMIIKFKVDGLLTAISFIATIGIQLLLLRYTNTTISFGGVLSGLVLIVVDAYFMITILNNIKNDNSYENVANTTLKTYLDKIYVIIVLLILAVVFTFMREARIYSIGMVLFYGIISIAISNLVLLRGMLMARHK